MVSVGEIEKLLMRVLLCKSFICRNCKPSPHIYTSGPLKLENSAPNVPQKLVSVPHPQHSQNKVIFDHNCLKSNLRKPNSDSAAPTQKHKKTVQWTDLLGNQLVEIREFESSEIEDTHYEANDKNRSCTCVIL